MLRAYQDAVAGESGRFEGHVAKFMGDGVLAYFGWPRAHEDEAERAVRAGLAIVEAVGRLPTPAGERLAARVGIATGLVVVGGSSARARRESRRSRRDAEPGRPPAGRWPQPGTVVIAASTRRLIGAGFEVEDLGPQVAQGLRRGVRRVARARRARGRQPLRGACDRPDTTGGARAGGGAPASTAGSEAREGDGQVVLLSGEPGIGKSRIARAPRRAARGRAARRLRHQCSPYYVDTALHPLIEHLERAAGFQRDDPPDAKLDKLEALLARRADRASRGGAADRGAPVHSDGGALPAAQRVTRSRQREATIEALVERVTGLARRRPVLVLFEDLHWADPTTLELLDRLVGRIAGERVLLLLTFRSEFSPPWRGRPHATLISLNRLPRRQSAALAEAVAGTRALPDAVAAGDRRQGRRRPAVRRGAHQGRAGDGGDTGAAPSSERVRAGPTMLPPIPVDAAGQPHGTSGSPGGAKELAQIGAAIGREFGYELLAAVSRLPEARASARPWISSSRPSWCSSGGAPPAATYTFKHALVQDVAYASLLKSRRQQLHARIARELEGTLAGDEADPARAPRLSLRRGRSCTTKRGLRARGGRPPSSLGGDRGGGPSAARFGSA